MEKKIEGVSAKPPLLIPLLTKGDKLSTSSPVTESEIKEEREINLWTNPTLFSGIRNVLLPAEVLRNIISWQRSKLTTDGKLSFSNPLKPDKALKDTLEEVMPSFFKTGVNLENALERILIK